MSQDAEAIRQLFTRRLDQSSVTPLPGSEGATAPFFKPDGQWVAFFAKGKLKKSRLDGGDPVVVCDAPQGRGGTWTEDDHIIASLNTLTGLSVVSSDGGNPEPLTELAPRESTQRWPQVLPGDKAVIFSVNSAGSNFEESDIAAVSLQNRRRTTVIPRGGMYPRYLPSGHLIYVTKGSLFAVPFDPDRLEVRTGRSRALAEVSESAAIGFAQVDVARNGTLVYRIGGREDLRAIAWLDGAGNTTSFPAEPGLYNFPRLSPDGTRVAMSVTQGANTDLWVYEWQRGGRNRLTNAITGAPDTTLTAITNPVWTADGRFVVFRATGGLFWALRDGSGTPQRLMASKSGRPMIPMSFTSDGTLLFSQLASSGGGEIRTLKVEGEPGQLRVLGDSEPLFKTATADVTAAFSPDGHWLAYADIVDGDYQVYVRSFPDRGLRKVQVSNTVGMLPYWSATGDQLFYRTDDQKIMVVNYTVKGESFTPDKPRIWSETQLASMGTARNYDLAPDGRFLVLLPTTGPEPRATQSHVMIATNVFEEIRQQLTGQGK